MPNVYFIAAFVVMVALAGTGWKAYGLGADHVRAEYAARDIAQANEAAAQTKRIQDDYRAKEQALQSRSPQYRRTTKRG